MTVGLGLISDTRLVQCREDNAEEEYKNTPNEHTHILREYAFLMIHLNRIKSKPKIRIPCLKQFVKLLLRVCLIFFLNVKMKESPSLTAEISQNPYKPLSNLLFRSKRDHLASQRVPNLLFHNRGKNTFLSLYLQDEKNFGHII